MIKDNWLNTVTSGSYKFTFYITSTDVWNNPFQYLKDDDQALNAGQAIIVAEDGVEQALAVQNVMILTNAGDISTGHANATVVHLEILEPLGFGMLDKALTVAKQLGGGTSTGVHFNDLNFVLRLDFVGRDPVTGGAAKYPDPFFYKLKLSQLTGSLGNAGAKYSMVLQNQQILGQQDGVTPAPVTVRGVTTPTTFLAGLETSMNDLMWDMMDEKQDQPHVEYVIKFDDSAKINAIDFRNLPGFDLATTSWAGLSDTGTSGGQSEDLEVAGSANVTIADQSQLTARIKELIAANTPAWAEFTQKAREIGITYSLRVEPSIELSGENDPILNQPRRVVTFTVGTVIEGTIPPLDANSLLGLRNSARVQQDRFDEVILPNLVKKYTYQYTGENLEVQDIDLQLNNLFFNARQPAAGIYYADNHNMFEANITPLEQDPRGPHQRPSSAIDASGTTEKYLSDVKIPRYNLLQSPVFQPQALGAQAQQVNETTATDKLAASALDEYQNRVLDAELLTLEVKGDPVFMGDNGKDLFAKDSAVYMAFVNFAPEPDDLLLRQQRGPLDLVTTGIYKITSIESKFSNGSFTQTLKTMKDGNSTSFLLANTLIELEVE